MKLAAPPRFLSLAAPTILAYVLVGIAIGIAPADSFAQLPPTGVVAVAPDAFKVSAYDVATSRFQSKSGYGGAGSSGGAGDNTVRIVNPTQANGTLCAMIYVFDDLEQMQTCCGCPVTPDGLRTLSTVNDLTLDFGVNDGNLNAGVIEIVSALQNWTPGSPPPAPNPPGTNSLTSGTTQVGCSPTGIASTDVFRRASEVTPTPGLRAFITRDELVQPGNIVGGTAVHNSTAEEFLDAPIDQTHLNNLQSRCAFLISNGSGSGVCTCGVGDNSPAFGISGNR